VRLRHLIEFLDKLLQWDENPAPSERVEKSTRRKREAARLSKGSPHLKVIKGELEAVVSLELNDSTVRADLSARAFFFRFCGIAFSFGCI